MSAIAWFVAGDYCACDVRKRARMGKGWGYPDVGLEGSGAEIDRGAEIKSHPDSITCWSMVVLKCVRGNQDYGSVMPVVC